MMPAADTDHVDVVTRQQAMLLTMYRTHLEYGDRYALVDFPDHPNVGDSAIWLGEIAALRAVTGRGPDYVSTWEDFDEAAFRAASPHGILFLHGGGNLGDIWMHHQFFRERLLSTIRDRKVVQLPQSIHFRSPDRIAGFAAIVANHPDFHLYARDRPSLDFARRFLRCPVGLAPDSAFSLGHQTRGAADCDVLMLLRTDDERAVDDRTALAAVTQAVRLDWLTEDALPVPGDMARTERYDRLATARLNRGLALLSHGRRIVTDRLHGHILATLLGIPHIALDNDYGKISAYVATWTQTSPLVDMAASASDAVISLRRALH